MPHIRTLFPEDGVIRGIIKVRKKAICELVASQLGYDDEDVALVPEVIPQQNTELAENIMPLEFVIDAGSRPAAELERHVEELRHNMLFLMPELGKVHFGIWLRSMTASKFAEHKPENHDE